MARVNRTHTRADKFKITGIKNMKRSDGTYIMGGRSRLVKEVDYYTMECPECGGDGWYDERGDVICENGECGCVLSYDGRKNKPLIYPEDDYGGASDSSISRGASGHPLMRVPALNDPGPAGGD